jgi:hypothetical protein
MYHTDRVDGFQIADVHYWGLPPKDTPPCYEVIQWYEHDPWEVTDARTGEKKTVTESCYVVAFIEWNPKEPDFEFRSVGLRWLEAAPTNRVIKMILDFCEEKEKELLEDRDY